MSENKNNKFCNLYRDNKEQYVEFKILSKEQTLNNTILVPKNPLVRVNLLMVKGVVKKLREDYVSEVPVLDIGVCYATDNLAKVGQLDYEVLFTDDVEMDYLDIPKSQQQVTKTISGWINCKPLVDSKTGIKFFHISRDVYKELSELIELNDKLISGDPKTVDLWLGVILNGDKKRRTNGAIRP